MTREEMRAAIRPLMSEERYLHSLGVEREAERLARRWGEDPEKAAVAGILHDCCKEMPLPEALQIVGQSAIIPDIDFREQPQLIHGYAAAELLGSFGVRDREIEDAVRYHTTGRTGMSRLEKIIFVADYIGYDRRFPEAAAVRRVARRSLDEACGMELAFTRDKLLQKGKTIVPLTLEAIAEFE